ncbi:hypothetical protein AAC387_Pa05g0302 [Persea americana]
MATLTTSATPQDHIVMFPYMAQGHIIPFLSLAYLIQRLSPHTIITLVSTPLNIQTLQSSLPPGSTLHLATLPFSSSAHGLPHNSENTDSLPTRFFIPLFQASQTLQPSFENLLHQLGRPPTCIIADVFLGWTVESARKIGAHHAVFTTCGGYGTASYFSLWLHLPHSLTDSDEFHLPGFPDSFRIHRTQLSPYMRAADGKDPWSIFFRKQISLSLMSDFMLCNTVEEVEKTGVELLRKNTGLPVWSIGPLLPQLFGFSSSGRVRKEPGVSSDDCIAWLNLHRPSSVLYISFGSQNTISAAQMMELAIGLESTGKNFIWVVRPPIGHDINGSFLAEEWLPEGFEDRIAERKQGLLVRNWAPQLEILGHESTGAFLSHCGWNSVLESLSNGVPMIGWPLASEQFYNVKMMEEELGVCVEVARGSGGDCGVVVERGKVKEVIEVVMGETEKGEEMDRKAGELKEMMRAAMEKEGGRRGSSLMAIDDFLSTISSKGKIDS